jgi:hypothetical protein
MLDLSSNLLPEMEQLLVKVVVMPHHLKCRHSGGNRRV